jgi:hypothetical protein
MGELLVRFIIGGVVVSIFSTLGDVLRPKSFAGLFGAAPSIALATIGLTIHHNGKAFVALEARSMMLGALAFCVYAASTSWLLRRFRLATLVATMGPMPVWFMVSFGLWFLMERSWR